jgi:hypothetical protein
MSKFKFSPLNLGRLGIDAIYALNDVVIGQVSPLRSSLSGILAATYDYLVSTNSELGKSLRNRQKNLITDELEGLDAERDADIRLLFKICKNYQRRADKVLKNASNVMLLFLGGYKSLASLPLDVQTRVTREMLSKYAASEELKAAAAHLAIDHIFVSLEAHNNVFAQKYEQRNDEVAGKAVSGTSLRPALNAAFLHFCSSLEITLNYTSDPVLEALFYKIDELRKKYHFLEGKPDTDTPETPETPEA